MSNLLAEIDVITKVHPNAIVIAQVYSEYPTGNNLHINPAQLSASEPLNESKFEVDEAKQRYNVNVDAGDNDDK